MTLSRYFYLGALAFLFLLAPFFLVQAQPVFPGDVGPSGLAACGDPGEPICDVCQLENLARDLLRFAVYVAVFLATILIAYAGFRMVMAQGDTSAVKEAKEILVKAILGLVFVLAAWLIVDTLMKTFFKGGSGWNTFGKCEPQPGPSIPNSSNGAGNVTVQPSATPTGTYTPGAGTYSEAGIRSALQATERFANDVELLAALEGIPLERARAMMMIESAGNPTVVSPKGAVGLLQILPSTARGLDPQLKNLSHDEITERLKNPAYNMSLGYSLYGSLYRKYGNNADLATAAYSGGDKANQASTLCPGELAWQCSENRGYAETRNYINNVNQIGQYLKSR